MSYHEMLLNNHLNQQDKNESVYDYFKHEVAKDLYLLYSHKRQTIESLKDYILDLKESLWVTRFEMSGDEWNFADEVDEAVEEAIITCNDWDYINNMGEK
jgi:hypothetical protein